jgi:hypothetical protein
VFSFIHIGYLCGGDSCGCGRHHDCLGSLGHIGGRFVVLAVLALLLLRTGLDWMLVSYETVASW